MHRISKSLNSLIANGGTQHEEKKTSDDGISFGERYAKFKVYTNIFSYVPFRKTYII